jgi:CubicO group peptidase (beta-lactamase class C family)
LVTGQLLSPTVEAERLHFEQVPAHVDPLPTQKGDAPSLPVRYGLGVANFGGLLGHNGGVKGYVDDVFYSPARHATIVVFANADPTAISSRESAADALTVSIADTVLPRR